MRQIGIAISIWVFAASTAAGDQEGLMRAKYNTLKVEMGILGKLERRMLVCGFPLPDDTRIMKFLEKNDPKDEKKVFKEFSTGFGDTRLNFTHDKFCVDSAREAKRMHAAALETISEIEGR